MSPVLKIQHKILYEKEWLIYSKFSSLTCDKMYTRKYSHPFYFHSFSPRCQRVNLSLGEFLLRYLSLSTTVSELIQAWAKLFASVEMRKLHILIITMYKVL